jgi:ABC-type uncharacterized transport system auxiliary subunit
MLSGCFSSPAVEEHFYALTAPLTLEKGRGPRLLVGDFTASGGYDTARLAYRVSDHEIRYYAYRQWVSEAPRHLAEVVSRHLRASGRFSEVGRGDKMREPEAVLEGTVDAIEEVDTGDAWRARLAMTFRLRRVDSDALLLRDGFDVTMPCARRDPDEVARTMSGILAREMDRLARRIANTVPK